MSFKTIIFSLSFMLCVSFAISQEKKTTAKEEVTLIESNAYIKKTDSLIALSHDMEFSTKYITQLISEGTIQFMDSLKVEIGLGAFSKDTFTNQETDEIVKIRYSNNVGFNEYSISKDSITYERMEVTIYYKNEKPYIIFYDERKRKEKNIISDIKYRFQVTKEDTIKESSDNEKNKIATFALRYSKQLIKEN